MSTLSLPYTEQSKPSFQRCGPSLSASLRQAEDATKKLEECRVQAATRLQAVARGRQVQQNKARMEKSARTLQQAFRRFRRQWLEGRGAPGTKPYIATGRRKEWAEEFWRAASTGPLQKSGFLQALRSACGEKVSPAQAEKLWAGFLEQSESGDAIALSTFLAICEAVLQGDSHAAEFAALSEEEYMACSAGPDEEAGMSCNEFAFDST